MSDNIEGIQKTPEELQAEIEKYRLIDIKLTRAAVFRTEADPLFFKAQRGECSIEEWKAKVEEIRQRHPYDPQQ